MRRGRGKAQTRGTIRSQVGCHTAVSALLNLPEYNEEGEGQGSDQGDNEADRALGYHHRTFKVTMSKCLR